MQPNRYSPILSFALMLALLVLLVPQQARAQQLKALSDVLSPRVEHVASKAQDGGRLRPGKGAKRQRGKGAKRANDNQATFTLCQKYQSLSA